MLRALARLGVVVLLVVGGAASAQQEGVLGRWTGTFTWDEEPDRPQRLEVEFVSQTGGPNGTQRFIGRAVYRTERVINFELTLDLDPRTRAVQLTEGAADVEGWVNDGIHVGTLSPDGSRIEARWVSKSDRAQQGRLVLTRVGTGGK
jgi:hypothetical protein